MRQLLIFSFLLVSISLFSQEKEMKFIDGDIMYGYEEISFKRANKLSKDIGCDEAAMLFKKASKKSGPKWAWGIIAIAEAGIGGAMLGIGEPVGFVSIGASAISLAGVYRIEKKQKYLALEGIDIFNSFSEKDIE